MTNAKPPRQVKGGKVPTGETPVTPPKPPRGGGEAPTPKKSKG
jgi:hypothetical protein